MPVATISEMSSTSQNKQLPMTFGEADVDMLTTFEELRGVNIIDYDLHTQTMARGMGHCDLTAPPALRSSITSFHITNRTKPSMLQRNQTCTIGTAMIDVKGNDVSPSSSESSGAGYNQVDLVNCKVRFAAYHLAFHTRTTHPFKRITSRHTWLHLSPTTDTSTHRPLAASTNL